MQEREARKDQQARGEESETGGENGSAFIPDLSWGGGGGHKPGNGGGPTSRRRPQEVWSLESPESMEPRRPRALRQVSSVLDSSRTAVGQRVCTVSHRAGVDLLRLQQKMKTPFDLCPRSQTEPVSAACHQPRPRKLAKSPLPCTAPSRRRWATCFGSFPPSFRSFLSCLSLIQLNIFYGLIYNYRQIFSCLYFFYCLLQ